MSSASANGGYLTPEQISNLLHDYADNSIPVKQIEAKYHVHSTRIYAELQKAGLPRRLKVSSFRDELDAATTARIAKAYQAEQPIAEIAIKFGLNYDQVYAVIREKGLPSRTSDRRKNADPAFRERLAKLYADETLTVHEVAAAMDISSKTLARMVIRFGLPKRGRGGGNRGTPFSVASMLPDLAARAAAGEPLAKLAIEVGIGVSTLRQKLRKLRTAQAREDEFGEASRTVAASRT